MERSLFTALIGGLLGITAFGGLALVGSVPGTPEPPPSRPEGEWRLLDPVSYENISVYPVVSSYSQDTSSFLTLEEGLATREVAARAQWCPGLEGLPPRESHSPIFKARSPAMAARKHTRKSTSRAPSAYPSMILSTKCSAGSRAQRRV